MISIKPLPNGLSMKDPAVLIATGFGSGRLSPAPGTWGSLAALIVAIPLATQGWFFILAALIAALIIGWWATTQFQEKSGTHDAGMIVVDEWIGLWLALLFAPVNLAAFVITFALFRLFDAWKPWPIRWLDKKIPGTAGVIVDDIAAGLVSGLIIFILAPWLPNF